ncbi:hypothetical protein L2E82_07913 [Cichorium intybus]|uniref:Uncharacterized protein n=1 Tax=Cichorium intybus TaxID=13427 RepID=A0ACB9G654_CICIN|nr:hypothetical protein L2E82_07913 [Cichorium intybus]
MESNRCAAYLRIGHFLKHRPASASERRPLSGLDPTTHASLALKDVEHFMKLQSHSVMVYILKANALILVVYYNILREILPNGFQYPPEKSLYNCLTFAQIKRFHSDASALYWRQLD